MPPSRLVVGYSEQMPDELRADRLMGVSSDGAVPLSRHGATYSASTDQATTIGSCSSTSSSWS